MDTLVITPNQLVIAGSVVGVDLMNYDLSGSCPLNASVYFRAGVFGTRTVNSVESTDYPRIGFGFGGIEWSVTCAIPGGDDPDTPVALSPKTYIDAYGKLHLGDEVQVGMEITVNAKLVNRNPSGSGYLIDADDPIVFEITDNEGFGNFNHAERFPYIIYQNTDTPTPASGAGIGEGD